MHPLLALIHRAATTPADPTRLDQIDHELLDQACPLVDQLCRTWFDHEVQGLDHIPEGPSLVVGNHNSGISFIEGLGFGARAYLEGKMATPWHALAHDAMVDMPLIGPFLIRAGAVRASHAMADAAFADGRKVLVFPGGNLEAFRPWSERNTIQFGQRKGFIRLALRHQVPITPVVFHGGQDAFVILSDGKWVARHMGPKRFLRSDTWPVYLGFPWGLMPAPMFHVPMPIKYTTRVLPPIPVDAYGPEAAEDPEVLQALYDQVIAAMQTAMDELVQQAPPRLSQVRRLASGVRRRLRR